MVNPTVPTLEMKRTLGLIVGLVSMTQLTARPGRADSTVAYCSLSVHDHTIAPTPLQACSFAQYQGNAYVRTSDGTQYNFPDADRGRAFQRTATEGMLRFSREGEYTLTVMWPSPAISCRRTDL